MSDGRKLILVVDDDPDHQETYGRLLWYNNYDTIFAARGREALELARQRVPDLVLLDLILPDMHGTEVCETLRRREETRHVPVVILTASQQAEYREWLEVHDCSAFLEKPLDPFELVQVVDRLIGPPPGDPGSPGEPETAWSGPAN